MSGFLDKLFGKLKPARKSNKKSKGKNNLTKEEYEYKPQSVDGKLILNGITPDVIGELSIDNNKYMFSNMKISFEQQLNKNKMPESMTQLGLISLTLIGNTDDLIDEWMINSRKQHSGDLRFFKNDVKEIGQSLTNVSFENAYCVEYEKNINVPENVNESTLIIYPEILKIGNEEF